jgi:hypothetical protein
MTRRANRQVYVTGILHPAYIIRGAWKHEPAMVALIRMAVDLAKGGFDPLDTSQPPPGANLCPSLTDLYEWEPGIDDRGVAVDIETAGDHLVAVGFCRLSDYRSVVVRFRRKGGGVWDIDPATRYARVEWVDRILGDPTIPLVFHNGQAFDVPYLLDLGFRVEGYNADTLIMSAVAYPEMPKGLEYLAVSYCRLPGWKHLVRDWELEDK